MSQRKEINYKDNIWPINYVDETRDQFIRVTLKSLIFYLIFLTVATTVILSKTSPATYIYTKILKDQFIDVDFTADMFEKMYPTVFDDIRTVDHFWKYLSQVAISSMYNTEWFNLYYQEIKNITEPKILFETSLLGVARLKLLQASNSSCPILTFFSAHVKQCFGYYSDKKSDVEMPVTIIYDFAGKPNTKTTTTTKKPKVNDTGEETDITGFNYTEPESIERNYGFLFLYANHSGGFIQQLVRSKNGSLFILQTLYSKKWITRATRLVYFEFNLYTPNLNLFFVCKLIFEFLPCGSISIRPSYYFQPIYFSRYNDPFDFVVMGLEFIFIFFTIYYIIQAFRNCVYYKKKYWKSFWSYIDILIIMLSIMMIISNICKIVFLWTILPELVNYPNYYADMDIAVFWQRFTNNLEAILLCIIWFKLIRFYSLNKILRKLGNTLSACKTGIFPFFVYFFIILIGFSLLGFILFGDQSDHFNHLGNAFVTLLMILPGYYKYYTYEQNNKIIGPIFFLAYILIIYFIFFFIFIGIIIDAYFNAKLEAKGKKSEVEVSEFLSRLPNNLCCPSLTNKRLKMSSKEIVSEIRTILLLSKFSNNDIKQFFRVYHIYEDKKIDKKHVFELLTAMKAYRLQSCCTILTCPFSASGDDSDKTIKLNTYLRQQRRFDFLGVRLYQISLSLEESTEILQQQEKTPDISVEKTNK